MRQIKRSPLLVVLILTLAAAIGSTHAADGRIPIYELPLVISQPGSYYLTRDLSWNGAATALEIQSSDVTIDFNGHTMDMQSNGYYAIYASGEYTNLRLHNGTLRGGNVGIFFRNQTGPDFDVRIHDMNVTGALNQGMYVEGNSLIGSSSVIVENNIVTGQGDDGIYLRYMWGGRVSDNVITRNLNGSASAHGLYLRNCRNLIVRGNQTSHFSGDGLRAWYSSYLTFHDNLSSYNSNWGLSVFDGLEFVFRNNRAYGNTDGGLDYDDDEGHINAGGNYPIP